ncbi:MAG: EamA family transporter [Deltaproteobacteria bacterium]|nr:EamA family transporter [Deltaproteobacteria bacterium]MDA8308549.1 EamA family transporter [Deltaproteobacteria bacterium]
MQQWLLYSILALLTWGVWGFLPKVALGFLEPGTAFVFEALGGASTGLLFMLILRPRLAGAPIMGIIPAFFTGVLGYLGLIFFMYAVRQADKISIVAPLTALYPIVTIALALIFLEEKINMVQFVGIVLALISIFLISYQ